MITCLLALSYVIPSTAFTEWNYNTRTFRLYNDVTVSRALAATTCMGVGMFLASIQNDGENGSVMSRISADVWLGANDITQEGHSARNKMYKRH